MEPPGQGWGGQRENSGRMRGKVLKHTCSCIHTVCSTPEVNGWKGTVRLGQQDGNVPTQATCWEITSQRGLIDPGRAQRLLLKHGRNFRAVFNKMMSPPFCFHHSVLVVTQPQHSENLAFSLSWMGNDFGTSYCWWCLWLGSVQVQSILSQKKPCLVERNGIQTGGGAQQRDWVEFKHRGLWKHIKPKAPAGLACIVPFPAL